MTEEDRLRPHIERIFGKNTDIKVEFQLYDNTINTQTVYAIDLKSTSNNVVTDNKLSSASYLGDKAVNYVEGNNNTVVRNGGNAIITIDANTVFVGNNNTIAISVVNATGNVTVKVNNKEYFEVVLVNGTVTIKVNASDIAVGENNITVTYNGDDYICVGTATSTFTALTNVVTEEVFYEFFDDTGFLNGDVPFDELIFKGEFNKLSYYIYLDKPIKITGENAVLNDMCIIINNDDVIIRNLTLNSTMEFGSLITVGGSNVTLSNLNITYIVGDVSAEIINVNGQNNVKLLNNIITFESNHSVDNDDHTLMRAVNIGLEYSMN